MSEQFKLLAPPDHSYLIGKEAAQKDLSYLYNELTNSWQASARAGRRIEAIKVYRHLYGTTLPTAKLGVEHYMKIYHERVAKKHLQDAFQRLMNHVVSGHYNAEGAKKFIREYFNL